MCFELFWYCKFWTWFQNYLNQLRNGEVCEENNFKASMKSTYWNKMKAAITAADLNSLLSLLAGDWKLDIFWN